MTLRRDNVLGFTWHNDDLSAPKINSLYDAINVYKQMLPSIVRDAAELECNPFNYVDIKTLIDGRTVGGYKLSDAEQVTNLIDGSKALVDLVNEKRFDLNKETITLLNGIIARKEALEWGVFRGEGYQKNYTPSVRIGNESYHSPLLTRDRAVILNAVFDEGIIDIKALPSYEGALVMFLFCAFQQFFFDGNKRTGRHMMNGWLMKHGFNPITIPASQAKKFDTKMVNFYKSKDATEMLKFLDSLYKHNA